jgi:hypothetical protein
MREVRLTLLSALVLMALVMKAPIWYLPAKLSAFTGGDGWHRSYLVDAAFADFDKWWLAGLPVLDTRDWYPYVVMTGGADLINYYLDFGIAAGLAALLLFVVLLIRAFRSVGRSLAAHAGRGDRSAELLVWGLGVVLAVHALNWFGLVYFDQLYVIWFMQLAAISSAEQTSAGLARTASARLAAGGRPRQWRGHAPRSMRPRSETGRARARARHG